MVYRFECSVLTEYNVYFEYVLFLYLYLNGEIAQLARAHGSYPWCRGFESLSRYFFDVIGNCCSVVVVKQEFVSQATALGARMCHAHSLIFVAEMLIFQGFRYFC